MRLTVLAASGVSREYQIVTLRHAGDGRARSAFYLHEPEELRGTAFLLEETLPATAAGLRVWVYLPSGARRVLEVQGATLSQPLLGSDFTYQDWRVWLPVADLEVVRWSGAEAVAGSGRLEVEARPRTPELATTLGWAWARVAVDPGTWMVERMQYFEPGEARPARVYRASAPTRVDGAWIPRRMVMSRPGSGERTVVQLIDAWHDREIPAAVLRPENLPELGRWLAAAAASRTPAQDP